MREDGAVQPLSEPPLDPPSPTPDWELSEVSGNLDNMHTSSPYGRARGDFERACRAAFKTLEKSPGPSAVEALDVVQRAADRVVRELVAEMRAAGASWADVAGTIGGTRQAAWERFGQL